MRQSVQTVVLSLCIYFSFAGTIQAQLKYTLVQIVDPWKIYRLEEANGQLNSCLANRRYQNGVILNMGISADWGLLFFIKSSESQFESGDVQIVYIDIDGQSWPVHGAKTPPDGFYMVPAESDHQAIYDKLYGGSVITFKIGSQTFPFDVSANIPSFDAVYGCVEKAVRPTKQGSPFVNNPGQQEQPRTEPKPSSNPFVSGQ